MGAAWRARPRLHLTVAGTSAPPGPAVQPKLPAPWRCHGSAALGPEPRTHQGHVTGAMWPETQGKKSPFLRQAGVGKERGLCGDFPGKQWDLPDFWFLQVGACCLPGRGCLPEPAAGPSPGQVPFPCQGTRLGGHRQPPGRGDPASTEPAAQCPWPAERSRPQVGGGAPGLVLPGLGPTALAPGLAHPFWLSAWLLRPSGPPFLQPLAEDTSGNCSRDCRGGQWACWCPSCRGHCCPCPGPGPPLLGLCLPPSQPGSRASRGHPESCFLQ